MKLKKTLLALTITILFVLSVFAQTVVQAAIATNPIYLGITELRTNDVPNMGYAIGDPNTNGAEGTAAKLWNLVKYSISSSNDPTENNIYCLKAGVGFTDVNRRADYNVFYDMKTEREAIKAQNEILKGLVEATIPMDGGTTISRYDAILAMLDLMYLNKQSTATQKAELIKAAGIHEGEFDADLTSDDIMAVQQAALWYFTNYGEESGKYDKTANTGWLNYTLDGTTYKNLADYNPTSTIPSQSHGAQRQIQAERLYNYFINTSKANANKYSTATASSSEAPAKVNTTTLNYEVAGTNYVIGPINITENQANPTPYTLDFIFKNAGLDVTDYQLLDQDKKATAAGTTVKDLVGNDFYVSIPKGATADISIDITISYDNTKYTLWASSKNNQEQPVVIPEKQNVVDPTHLTLKIAEPDYFDLKLIKRITAVNNQNVPERIEKVDVSKLNTTNIDGTMVTTGNYTLNKEPVGVKQGDIVTYTFRVYNEGTLDGYSQKVTEDVPEGLQFVWSEKTGDELKNDTTLTAEEKEAIEYNQNYLWGDFVYDASNENITTISTDYLSKENETTVGGNLIKAFGKNDGSKTEADISYKEVSVKFKVTSSNKAGTIIRNEAAITEDCDKDGNAVEDRDSKTDVWKKYEDDEDYDNVILQSFDLALRKFITAISNSTTIEEKDYLKNTDGTYQRAPEVDTSKLETMGEDGKLITTATYNHTKEPLLVQPNNIVVYMLRVYNEGEMDGYASEIKDHLPPNLSFVEGEFNEKYGWTLSEDGRTVTTTYLENSKINKASTNADGKIVLSYKEVPIMCQVKETAKTDENITNIADITKYLDENKKAATDRDSQADNVVLPKDENLPSYKEDEKGSYVPGQQDDDDFEKVTVKIFDLALRKWVTQAIVVEDGKQTVTNTGHQPFDDPEGIVKVEINRKKLNTVSVKFKYSIRVYNQGGVEGYAKLVEDYIPEGLKFVAEDNPGWTVKNDTTISTKQLENTLLKPGDYADLEVTLTWINSQDNLGLKVNTAEIEEDYNEYDLPDIDSTPDNQKQGEDDIDDAPVMLSVTTGLATQIGIYIGLGFVVLVTIAGGVILIKKYIL